MAISREELFGPILPIIEYDDIGKVIDQINANPKPLAIYEIGRASCRERV